MALKPIRSIAPFEGRLPQRLGAEFGDDFGGGGAGAVGLLGREADGAYASVAASAVALADLGQVHHLRRVGRGPRVGADGYLGAETGFRQADGVDRVRIEVIRDELVEALERMIGDVEEDGAIALFGAAADEFERFSGDARAAEGAGRQRRAG